METEKHFLFYTPDAPVEQRLTLDETESHHAQHVLRIQKSDTVFITNGRGTIYTCACEGFLDKKLVATIQNSEIIQRRGTIHLFIALPERDAFEEILTGCTALGVQTITPVVSAHCQRPWWKQSWDKHYERFQSKIIVAMKQSLYPFVTQLTKPLPLTDAINTVHGTTLVADQEGDYLIRLKNVDMIDTSIFIGPPGGFSSHEVDTICGKGGLKVKIGESRLRTELASVALCAQVVGLQ